MPSINLFSQKSFSLYPLALGKESMLITLFRRNTLQRMRMVTNTEHPRLESFPWYKGHVIIPSCQWLALSRELDHVTCQVLPWLPGPTLFKCPGQTYSTELKASDYGPCHINHFVNELVNGEWGRVGGGNSSI